MVDNIKNSTDENLQSKNEQEVSNESHELNQGTNNLDAENTSSNNEEDISETPVVAESDNNEESKIEEQKTDDSIAEIENENNETKLENVDESISSVAEEKPIIEDKPQIPENNIIEEEEKAETVENTTEVVETETTTEEKTEETPEDNINETGSSETVENTTEVIETKTTTEEKTEETPEENINETESSETVETVKTDTEKTEIVENENPEKSEDKTISENESQKDSQAPNQEIKIEKTKIEDIDFSKLEKSELIEILSEIIESTELEEIQKIKTIVDEVKTHFYKKHNEEIALQEEKYKSENEDGTLEGFVPEVDENAEKLKELLKIYKTRKYKYNQQLEKEKEDNLKQKLQIIEDIKDLAKGSESLSKTFNDFRDLQNRWKNIGLVPQASLKDLWETYHYYVERFYDFIKINKELRDLDLKKNLEHKLTLCEKAEELILEPSILKAFKSLQKLHEQWREIGPIPREKREEIWERFKETTTKINIKHQAYFEELKNEQHHNLEAKIVLCEKVEEIAKIEIVRPKEWEEKSKEIIEVQKLWKTIGFATKKENSKIYDRFRHACNNFFNKKRDFFAQSKEEQANNLQQKINLCIQAEGMKESTDWKKSTDDYIKLQRTWKEIGPVPRRDADKIWKRFRSACDTFFNNKEKYFSEIDARYSENYNLKLELIKKIQEYQRVEDDIENLESLKNFQSEWTKIGHVSYKHKDEIQAQYREAVNKQFEKLNMDDSRRNILFFKHKIENLAKSPNGKEKLRFERDKMIDNIKHLENDIILLDNNIGFFAKTKNAESLIKDVNNKIEKAKKNIKAQKQKLDLIYKAM